MHMFQDRTDAGRQLARALRELLAADDQPAREPLVVLAIPRGGVPVAAEVAAALDAAFDVAVVRKLRSPHNPELGFGAVGTDGHVDLDEAMVQRLALTDQQIDAEIADRREAVQRRLQVYRAVIPAAQLRDATVIVVDDGVATGGSARRACALARRSGAARVILAAPVAPRPVVAELEEEADEVVVLSQPAEFLAVGQAYQDFEQLDDDAALAVLRGVAGRDSVAPGASAS